MPSRLPTTDPSPADTARPIHQNTLAEWERRFGEVKSALVLYGLNQTFIQLTFEGDKLCTVAGQRVSPVDSTGWTAVILERVPRFLADPPCGHKDDMLFKRVMKPVAASMKRTQDLTFLSGRERCYSHM